MKSDYTFLRVVYITFLLFVLSGCDKNTQPTESNNNTNASTINDVVTIGGHVDDCSNVNTPIQGAVVGTSLDSMTAITDANGSFQLKTNTPAHYSNTAYTISINASGYQTGGGTWIWGDHPANQVFCCTKDAGASTPNDVVTIGGHVDDCSNMNAPIQGAVVGTSLDSITATTDVNGSFQLITNTPAHYSSTAYMIVIRASGYQTGGGTWVWGDHPINQVFCCSKDTGTTVNNDVVTISGRVDDCSNVNTSIQGAIVGTSLDTLTAITDAGGNFQLKTNTPAHYSNTPYTIIINASGYKTGGGTWTWGDHPANQVFCLSH